MDADYKWVIPVCTVVCVFVLAVDIALKNSIVTESVKLREVIASVREERSGTRIDAESNTRERNTSIAVVD